MLKAKQRLAMSFSVEEGISRNAENDFVLCFEKYEAPISAKELADKSDVRFLMTDTLVINDLERLSFNPIFNLETPYFLITYSLGVTASNGRLMLNKKQYDLRNDSKPRVTCIEVPDESVREDVFFYCEGFEISLYTALRVANYHNISFEEFCKCERDMLEHLVAYANVGGY
jgi:hypothetical protein